MDYRLCHSRGSVRYSGQRGRLRERPEPRLPIEFATRYTQSASQGAVRQTTRRADEKLYSSTVSPKVLVLPLTVTNRYRRRPGR